MNLIKPYAVFRKKLLKIAAMIFLTTGASTMFAATVDVENMSREIVQQPVTISGTVKDVNGDLLIGVSVQEKGTLNGTVTNLNGAF